MAMFVINVPHLIQFTCGSPSAAQTCKVGRFIYTLELIILLVTSKNNSGVKMYWIIAEILDRLNKECICSAFF